MTKIINLFTKEPDRKEYEERLQKEEALNEQRHCSHGNSLEWIEDEDKVTCNNCGKRFTSFEYMCYQAEKGSVKQINSMYHIRNEIYFLQEKKQTIETDIEHLRREKRALNKDIKKLNNESTGATPL